MAYAAGATAAPVELFVASHLTYCAECRARVGDLEAVGGALLLGATPVPVDRVPDLSVPMAPPPVLERCPVLPSPVRRVTGPVARVAWRHVGLGLRIAPVGVGPAPQRTFLLELPAGFRIPTHGHHGTERVLVLGGGFTDRGLAYAVGDVSWQDDATHAVRIDDDGPCLALFVNDGPLDVGWGTKLLDRWLRTSG